MKSITVTPRKDARRSDGSAPLYASFFIGRHRIRLHLGITVPLASWDEKSQSVRKSDPDAADVNLLINEYRARITDVFVRARLQNVTLTKERFMAAFHNPHAATHVAAFMRSRLKTLSVHLSDSTVRHHRSVIDKFEQFFPQLIFSEFNTNSLNAFAVHLKTAHNNARGTIRKNLQIIHQYVHDALEENLMSGDPFRNFRMPVDNPRQIFLKESELETLVAIYRADNLADIHQTSLRFFLFMCYTGMHISDARALRIENIEDGIIRYERIKTLRPVKVPVCGKADELIEFYREGRSKGVLVRGLPSDQQINRSLKYIAGVAGIRKSLSAIVARHTFASIYMKYNSDDAVGLATLLGHSSIRYVGVYAHAEREKLVESMTIFDKL